MEVTGRRTGNKYDLIPTLSKIKNSISPEKISLLKNNVEYFLHEAFILIKKNDYQLVVIHDGQVRTNKCYATLRRAKTAFAGMYNRKAWKKEVKPLWSSLFKPGSEWFAERITILESMVKCG
jgi:hypothetical protein